MNYTQVNNSHSSTKVEHHQDQVFPDIYIITVHKNKTLKIWHTAQSMVTPLIYIEQTSDKVVEKLARFNMSCPKDIITECISNFYHSASDSAAVIINLDTPSVTFIDDGKGIQDTHKALTIGYSTTGIEDRTFIRGLGLGFSLIKNRCKHSNISCLIESAPEKGTKINLIFSQRKLNKASNQDKYSRPITEQSDIIDTPHYCLTKRQREVLNIVNSVNEVGPSVVSDLLGIPLSTAYRDLHFLEHIGFITSLNKKRQITTSGFKYLQR